jgi:hypothetical protein
MPAQATKLFLLGDLEDSSRTSKLADSDLDSLRVVTDWITTFQRLARPGLHSPRFSRSSTAADPNGFVATSKIGNGPGQPLDAVLAELQTRQEKTMINTTDGSTASAC